MADSIAPDFISNMYRQNHGWLLGWLRSKLGSAVDAADVAQDTYVRVIDTGRLPEYEQQSRAYLARIAKHLVVDLQRRRRLEYAYLEALAHFSADQMPSVEQRAITLQTLCLLDAALDRLPLRVREAFLLSQFDGLTYQTIAERMGVSLGSVRKYMFQAAQACFSVMV
ncbi:MULTISPECIES: sigma-70 family RNA polymerase sigma factor [unclassified Janthinobacterium]|uniref:sigma-70 family RNA polymerase sigma factor n=1 Tax=unclassified Janthinobacterium TaxID=2610881 RepID=UPI00160E87A5|nr:MULTISPECIES: sigma-70 family RNA polymerase sigma factor [unclassified Janthinobacterium]MBB5610067.1 RNA polymerase sigma-70 factor (ECF subfamily) [Janthinobacterium sp. S3T4]MBB5615299.1 RNA polymerase sigma-70 factor (ECF subfamily) [Janthinobacterium sp. S3M3]